MNERIKELITSLPQPVLDEIEMVSEQKIDLNLAQIVLKEQIDLLREEKREEEAHKLEMAQQKLEALAVKTQQSDQKQVTDEDIAHISEGLAILSRESALDVDREELAKLKGELISLTSPQMKKTEADSMKEEYFRDVLPMMRLAARYGLRTEAQVETLLKRRAELGLEDKEPEEDVKEHVEKLRSRVNTMLSSLEHRISDVEGKVGNKLNLLDQNKDGLITTQELEDALRASFKDTFTNEQIHQIKNKLDKDNDGRIDVAYMQKLATGDLGIKTEIKHMIEELEKEKQMLQQTKKVSDPSK